MRQLERGRNAYTKDGEEDVDEEISTASALEEDSERREEDGNDDLADVAEESEHGLVKLTENQTRRTLRQANARSCVGV